MKRKNIYQKISFKTKGTYIFHFDLTIARFLLLRNKMCCLSHQYVEGDVVEEFRIL